MKNEYPKISYSRYKTIFDAILKNGRVAERRKWWVHSQELWKSIWLQIF